MTIINKLRAYAKLVLILCVFVKILSMLITLFSSSEYFDFFISFSIYALPYSIAKGYDINSAYEGIKWLCTMLVSFFGWPVSIVLMINVEERVWVPSGLLTLLSIVDICCCVESILSWSNQLNSPLLPHVIINIIYNVVIILFAVLYVISSVIVQKQIRAKYLSDK